VSLRGAARRVVKSAAAGLDAVRRPPRGIVVLLYHRIGPSERLEMELSARTFQAQMTVLAEEGRAVTLDRALELLGEPKPPGADPVVVSFDDGSADFVEAAVPILARFEIPATLYLATGFVEDGLRLPYGGRPLSWGGLADALTTGLVTVGSHTHGHALLDRLPPGDVAEELDRSIDLVGERLGVRAHHFAYPKGVPGSAAARVAVRDRFVSAALGGNRPNRYERTDLFRLARSPIQASDGMRWFRRKLAGGMALEEDVRGLGNRLRYAAAFD
jgi:peptidoglycan/xylan/chitin deacetylase (PgdA/CDA1 family)